MTSPFVLLYCDSFHFQQPHPVSQSEMGSQFENSGKYNVHLDIYKYICPKALEVWAGQITEILFCPK